MVNEANQWYALWNHWILLECSSVNSELQHIESEAKSFSNVKQLVFDLFGKNSYLKVVEKILFSWDKHQRWCKHWSWLEQLCYDNLWCLGKAIKRGFMLCYYDILLTCVHQLCCFFYHYQIHYKCPFIFCVFVGVD